MSATTTKEGGQLFVVTIETGEMDLVQDPTEYSVFGPFHTRESAEIFIALLKTYGVRFLRVRIDEVIDPWGTLHDIIEVT